MATPSTPCRLSWSTSRSYGYSSPAKLYTSAFLFNRRRHRRTTFSLHFKSSSAANTCVCRSSDASKSKPDKSPGLESSTSQSGASAKNAANGVASRDLLEKGRTLSIKSLFGKRSLWRRILPSSKKLRSIILLNVITVIYASNIPVVKEVEALTDAAAFTALRFAISALPFIPFVVRARDDVETRNAGIELGFWVSLGYLFQALGMLTSDAGRASFISMLTVVVVPLLDGMLGAIIPARTWFGALMSIIGVAMLESSGSPPCVGDLLNFFSAMSFGIHMLRTEHISRNTEKKNLLSLLGYEVCVIALSSAMWYLIGGRFDGSQATPSDLTWTMFWNWVIAFPWIPAFYTGIFSTGLCLWVEMEAMRDVSATETAIIYALEPVWGAAFAWLFLDERWGAAGWIGASLVLGGSLTVQIFGSSSSGKSREAGKKRQKDDHLVVSDKQSRVSASPVAIKSRKNVTDVLRN